MSALLFPRRRLLAAAAVLAAPPIIASAADWPGNRPIRMIQPSQAGSPADAYARLLAEHLGRALGVPCVVENRVGGTGTVGTGVVAAAAPDGWTIMMTSNTSHVVAPLVIRGLPYDPVRDFASVAALYKYGMMLIVSPTLPVRTAREFADWGKAQRDGVNLASVGLGSVGHLMAERFYLRAGFQRTHIPYRGGPSAILAVSQGESDYIFDNIGNSGAFLREGRLRGLALTGANRAPQMPAIPTLAEAGFPGFSELVWFGLWAPAGTPRPIVERLNAETNRWLATPTIQARMAQSAHEHMTGTPEEMDAFWAEERRLWTAVVQETGVVLE